MYILQKLHKQKIESTFFIDFLKAESEDEFLISGTFFQRDLCAMLSETNISVLRFGD